MASERGLGARAGLSARWPARVPDAARTATVASAALALGSIPASRVLRRRGVPRPVADAVVTAAVGATGWAMLALLERVAPHDDSWTRPDAQTPADRAFFGLLGPTLVAGRVVATAVEFAARRGSGLGARRPFAGRPVAVQVSAGLLVTELVHYWHHRAAHRWTPMWRAHAVHHAEGRLYWLNGTHVHPLDEAPLVGLQSAALALLGLDEDAVLVHNSFKVLHGVLQHTNVAGDPGAFAAVFSTPAQHRFHHARTDGRAVNFGSVLSVWDRVFGTDRRPDVEAPIRLGSAGSEVPTDFVGQVLYPFARADRSITDASVASGRSTGSEVDAVGA